MQQHTPEKTPLWPDLRPATEIGEKLLASTPLYNVGRVAEKLLALERLDQVYLASRRAEGRPFFENVLSELKIFYDCPDAEMARIPEKGPVVLVANHPFGLAEAPVLASLVSRRRPDFRFLANSMLGGIEILRDRLIAVNPFGGHDATRSNFRGMRAAVDWLRRGGLLAVFPAGEVASVRLPEFRVADPAWNETIGRIARITGATVVPVFFHGSNSAAFQIAGMIHPRLRTALLPREFFEKSGRTISVSIGAPVSPRITTLLSDRELTMYLRIRTELLETRKLPLRPLPARPRKPQAIAEPEDHARIRAEVELLDPIVSSRNFSVYLAGSERIPALLREIGRLREITFRAAGEGTGLARDLDRFDAWYHHLFLWDSEREQVAGAYRIGLADAILAERGPRGLYTSTLFKFEPGFLRSLGAALELGRSFVSSEYQRDFHPLLLLWKGIGHFVTRNPRYRTLFGPVSISSDYNAVSRALIVHFCKDRSDPRLSRKVRPRRAFRSPLLAGMPIGSLAENVAGLSNLIADLEPDNKGVPVLLRQYLNLGGNVIEFNVDPKFSNAVDGLIVVDLLKADRRLLERYMGRDGLASFCGFHGELPDQLQPQADLPRHG